ncbi:MAG TPA: exodeoxyribonuclease VII small subunit [Accumulibacter sp.]|jgi:exodeoxyribonuclease VII small subunit|nr:exodeoxyribonuclease VII small subunit [Accumulibacter sp.]
MARQKSDQTGGNGAAEEGESALGKLSFEAALAELEQIVQSMESGRLPLEESLTVYRRGNELLKHCQQRLIAAEQQIQILDNGLLHDFAAESGDMR